MGGIKADNDAGGGGLGCRAAGDKRGVGDPLVSGREVRQLKKPTMSSEASALSAPAACRAARVGGAASSGGAARVACCAGSVRCEVAELSRGEMCRNSC